MAGWKTVEQVAWGRARASAKRMGWATLMLMGSALWGEISTAEEAEPVPVASTLVLAGGEVMLENGSNEAQLRQDFGLREGGRGGIEQFRWIKDDGADWQIFIDAQVLENPDQVSFDLEMNRPEEARLLVSLRHWTRYDHGAGLWYAPRQSQALLSPEILEKALSEVTVRYQKRLKEIMLAEIDYRFFSGRGDTLSTRFGDDFQYRVGGRPSRGVLPAMLESDEAVHSVGGRIIWQDGVRLSGFRARVQRREVDRRLVVARGGLDEQANRWTRQTEATVDDLFSMSAFSRREWGETMVGSMGVAFTRLDGSVSGARVFGANPEARYDPEFAALQFEDRGFLDLESRRQIRQWLYNLNVVTQPSETVRWMAGIRLEKLSSEVFGSYLDTYSTVDWEAAAFQREEADMISRAERAILDVSGFVEGRYTGLAKWLFFARLEGGRQEGDLDEVWTREERFPDERDPVALLERATDFARATTFVEAGAHYYPRRHLQFSLKGYVKYRDNSYSLAGVSLPEADYTLYPGHLVRQVFETRDINVRVTWRVVPSLKWIGRLDYQESALSNTDRRLVSLESAERRRVVYNQSLTWSPWRRLFMTATYTYVNDLTETVAADLEGVFSGIVNDLPNDYWQVDGSVFLVLTKRIDLQVAYQRLELETAIDVSPRTIPYGTDLSMETISAGLVFHLVEGVRTRLEYRYFSREEPSAGGYNDYTAHLISGTVQVLF